MLRQAKCLVLAACFLSCLFVLTVSSLGRCLESLFDSLCKLMAEYSTLAVKDTEERKLGLSVSPAPAQWQKRQKQKGKSKHKNHNRGIHGGSAD